MAKSERSRWEIILDMLTVTLEEKKAKKTRIMQKANLNLLTFRRYFDFLQEEGFIAECDQEASYGLTRKGKDLLSRLKKVDEILQ